MDDELRWQFLDRLQVVQQGLLHEVALLHARRAHVLLEELSGGLRDDGRNLALLGNDEPPGINLQFCMTMSSPGGLPPVREDEDPLYAKTKRGTRRSFRHSRGNATFTTMKTRSSRAALLLGFGVIVASSIALGQSKPAKPPVAAPGQASAADALRKGDSAYVAHDLDAALAAYRAALAREPQNAALHYRVGQVQVAKGDLKEAEAAYLEALRVAKSDSALRAKLLFVVADLRERQKNHDAALEAWTKYEVFAKEKPDAKLYPQTAQERRKRVSEYKQLLVDYAAVKTRIEKRLQEAEARSRKSAQ
jgi:tetratricopeptide (TPR) repeat protein